MMLTQRFLTRGQVKPNATLSMLDGLPERQYVDGLRVPDPSLTDIQPEASLPLLVNFFRIFSDYLTEDVVGSLTFTNSEHREALRRAVLYRTMYGLGVLVNVGGRVIAVSPRGYWPVMEGGVQIGDVIVIPFSTEASGIAAQVGAGLPNRALVLENYDVDGGFRRSTVYEYSGITLGRQVMRGADFGGVSSFYGDAPDYPAISPIANALDDVLRASVRLVERHSQPHIQVPASLVEYDDAGSPRVPLSKLGTIFPVNKDDSDVKYVNMANPGQITEHIMSTLLTQLSAITHLPPHIFNLTPFKRMESGAAVADLSASYSDRLEVWRRDVIDACGRLGVDCGPSAA